MSRRLRSEMTLSGRGSNARTNTYRLFASFATRASVRKRGSPSSVGSKTRKSVIGVDVVHTASASKPSSVGGDFAVLAAAVVTATRAGGGRGEPGFGTDADCWDDVCCAPAPRPTPGMSDAMTINAKKLALTGAVKPGFVIDTASLWYVIRISVPFKVMVKALIASMLTA